MTRPLDQVKVLSIKQFAELCGTTPRTLRFYEQKGLIKPFRIDPLTKYRSYDARQAREFLKIKLLQNFDMPLKEISQTTSDTAMNHMLQEKLTLLKEELEQKKREYTFLNEIRTFLFEKDINKIFSTKWFGPYLLFCMRIDHADYNKGNTYLEQITKEATMLGLQVTGEKIAFYQTTTYEPKDTNIDVALICKQENAAASSITLPANCYFKRFPKTKALAYRYTGPFDYFSLIYQKLFDYIFQKNISLVDHVFDFHPNQPFTKYETSALLVFPIEQSF